MGIVSFIIGAVVKLWAKVIATVFNIDGRAECITSALTLERVANCFNKVTVGANVDWISINIFKCEWYIFKAHISSSVQNSTFQTCRCPRAYNPKRITWRPPTRTIVIITVILGCVTDMALCYSFFLSTFKERYHCNCINYLATILEFIGSVTRII